MIEDRDRLKIPSSDRRDRHRAYSIAACVSLILLHYCLGLSATLNQSASFDEPFHLTAGYSYNRFSDFRIQPENGLLPQRWMALPWLGTSLGFVPFEHLAWRSCSTPVVSHRFFYKEGNDPDRLLLWGRAMNGLWSVVFGITLFLWSRRISGAAPAWLTLSLWATSPLFLAHDFVATSDAAASLFFFASAGLLWSLLHRLAWGRLVLGCAVFAALFLSKFSAPLIVPIGLVMALSRLVKNDPWQIELFGSVEWRSRWRTALTMFGLACFLILTTWSAIWLSYGLRYSMFHAAAGEGELSVTWDQFLDQPDSIATVVAFARRHQLLPEAYLYGFSHTHHHSKMRKSFLLGEFSFDGWTAFFPFCELVKTPSGTWFLAILAVAAIASRLKAIEAGKRRQATIDKLYQTTPLWSLFLVYWFFAMMSHLNIGHRHVMPAEAPLLMLIGHAAIWWQRRVPNDCSAIETTSNASRIASRFSILSWMTSAGLIAVITACATAWPHYLAFFNLPSGGPSQAWKKLIDSSLDWGQDLPGLRSWIEQDRQSSSASPAYYLAYFGMGDPEYYRVQATLLPCFLDFRPPEFPITLQEGVFCISATMIHAIYTEYPGPWTESREADYQRMRELETRTRDPSFREAWPILSDADRRNWVHVFRQYDQLRLTRLTHFLRRRDPDAHVAYSILIYRVSAAELYQALNDPVKGTRSP